MRRTLLVLSALALLAIVLNAVFTEILLPAAVPTFNQPVLIADFFVPVTAQALVVAVSVVALVATAQRRQWGWFTGIFILILVSVYRDLVFLALAYVGLNSVLGHVPPIATDVVTLVVTPLATLVYSIVGAEAKPPAAAE